MAPSQRSPRSLRSIVVVGGSLAGLRACETLRTAGFGGSIVLIGAERHHPYDRPPLSKQLLAGSWDPDRITLRQPDAFAALAIDTRLGIPAAGLDVDGQSVALADGTHVPFDGLIIATGCHARLLPAAAGHPAIHELRTLDDALRLRDVVSRPGARVVVIGAGFIGLEVAATARRRGCEVTVLELAPAPLVRGVGAEMGTELAEIHADEGVDIRCGVVVADLEPDGVRLGDCSFVAADAIVVGVGVTPSIGWLEGSGVGLGDGVLVTPELSTGVPGVFAAGDCVRWVNPRFDEQMRVEHWTNAAEQGALAARNLLAEDEGGELAASDAVPFVWSDQYQHRIQFLGRSTTPDGEPAEARIVIGSRDERRFLAFYGAGGRLRGVLGLNLPRLVMKYRALLEQGASLADAMTLAAEQNAT